MSKPCSDDEDEHVDIFDEYGFVVFKTGSLGSLCDERNHNFSFNQSTSQVDIVKEWEKVFNKWMQYKNGIGVKLLHLIKKGVPSTVRPRLWKTLLEIQALKSNTSAQFKYQIYAGKLREQLIGLGVTEFNIDRAEHELARVEFEERNYKSYDPEIQNLRQIFLDVARTFPTHRLFFGDGQQAVEGRALLFRILGIYTKFNPTVGYCQGMSFIAGMLAINLPEEDAFWCLVALLQKPKFLHGYFDLSLSRVQRHAYVFDRLLKQRLPDLWSHLQSYNIDPLMYVTPWFMCLFTSLPCWDCILAIWDLMLLEGGTVIFRVAIAVMISLKGILMQQTDANSLILMLQKLPADSVNRETLLPIIWKTNVQWWEIEKMQALIDEEKTGVVLKAKNVKSENAEMAFSWKRSKQKIPENNESTFLKKFVRIFNGKKRYSASGSSAIPEIFITPASPPSCIDDEERIIPNQITNQSMPALKRNKASNTDPRRSYSPLKNVLQARLLKRRNEHSSISEDVSRINRLATGKKGQSRSMARLEEVVESLVGSKASQKFAFEEFTHQKPLRDTELYERSVGHSSFGSPEKELSSITVASPETPIEVPPKKQRSSTLIFSQMTSLPSISSAVCEAERKGKEDMTGISVALFGREAKKDSQENLNFRARLRKRIQSIV